MQAGATNNEALSVAEQDAAVDGTRPVMDAAVAVAPTPIVDSTLSSNLSAGGGESKQENARGIESKDNALADDQSSRCCLAASLTGGGTIGVAGEMQ